MKYYNLIETLKNLSASHEVIQEFGEGDVYEYMNSGVHKYPCLFMTMSNINSDVSSTDYNFTLFYIDRLTNDGGNRIYTQSTGISVIRQMLIKLISLNPDVELTSANYTLFTEKFADYCGGAFCNVVLSDVLQNTTNDAEDCNETDFGDLQISITKNGVYNVRGYSTADVKIDGLVLVEMTQNEYDNLEEYDEFTEYIILNDKNVITRIYQGTEIIYDNTPIDYVTFTAEEANSTMGLKNHNRYHQLEYSYDLKNWKRFIFSTNISLSNIGDKVYVRGILSKADGYAGLNTQFMMTGKIAASGNCNAIWNYKDLEGAVISNCGYCLFKDCTALTKAPDLPSLYAAEKCYYYMFSGCTSLVEAPELPAIELDPDCYSYMFEDCKALTKAPSVLPATTLAENCYESMFDGCNTLTKAPELPATKLNTNCYYYMFSYCRALVEAPSVLPATTLAENCYESMFEDCKALVEAPELPATKLAENCYYLMFCGCTSLVKAPSVLPATKLAKGCYGVMFSGCTSLVESPVLPATTLVENCYYSMFVGCSSLNKITCLALEPTEEMTDEWVLRGASTGTFIKSNYCDTWTTGVSGIPDGWTVENYDQDYITITPIRSEGDLIWTGQVSFNKFSTNQILQYRVRDVDSEPTTNWTTITSSRTIYLFENKCLDLRGYLKAANTTSNYTNFIIKNSSLGNNVAFEITGDCTSLWCEHKNQPLQSYCGYKLFSGCNYLTKAPELPATTLSYYCYSYMFDGCSKLVEAPELPATKLNTDCYYCMFNNCTSLVEAPELPATDFVDEYGYDSSSVYSYMFSGCTALTKAPSVLPALELKERSYFYMFQNCKSLVESPIIMAESIYFGVSLLKQSSLDYMFSGCSSLNKITCLASYFDYKNNFGIGGTAKINNWVSGVASTGTFYKSEDTPSDFWKTGTGGIPSGWTVEDYVE